MESTLRCRVAEVKEQFQSAAHAAAQFATCATDVESPSSRSDGLRILFGFPLRHVRPVTSRIASRTATRITTRPILVISDGGLCPGELSWPPSEPGLDVQHLDSGPPSGDQRIVGRKLARPGRRSLAWARTWPSGWLDGRWSRLSYLTHAPSEPCGHRWCSGPEREEVGETKSQIRDLRGMCWCECCDGHRDHAEPEFGAADAVLTRAPRPPEAVSPQSLVDLLLDDLSIHDRLTP